MTQPITLGLLLANLEALAKDLDRSTPVLGLIVMPGDDEEKMVAPTRILGSGRIGLLLATDKCPNCGTDHEEWK